jgi:hypothetical protein
MATVNISIVGHKASVSGPSVTPNSYIQVSASVALDSNTDTCLVNGSTCTSNDNGNVLCTAAGLVASFSVNVQDEVAFTQVYWVGNSVPPTCYANGVCSYPVVWDCTPDTTPPDDYIVGINSGQELMTLAPGGVTWRVMAFCFRYTVSGTGVYLKTPWICPDQTQLAFYVVFNGPPAPPYACTHNP